MTFAAGCAQNQKLREQAAKLAMAVALDEAELAEARGVLAEVECARQDAEGESASGKRSMSSRFLLRVHLPACPPSVPHSNVLIQKLGPL